MNAHPVGPFGIACMDGHAAIEMLPEESRRGSIFLPEEFSQTSRSDAGWVVASGIPVPVGSLVLVAYGHGARIKGYHNDVWKARSTLVLTGCAGGEMISDEYGDGFEGCSSVPWWESVIAMRENDDWSPMGKQVRIRLRPVESQGGISLTRKRYQPEATVVSVGPDAFTGSLAEDVSPGDTVLFDEGAVRRLVGTEDALIPDFAVHAKVLCNTTV